MHSNWLMPLGGDLSGTLPNPSVSAGGYFAGQIFARRSMSGALGDNPIQDRAFGGRVRPGLDGNDAVAWQVFRRAILQAPDLGDFDNDDAIMQSRIFRERAQETKAPVQWNLNKASTDTAETLAIPTGYQIVIADEFTNSGTIVNSGTFAVI